MSIESQNEEGARYTREVTSYVSGLSYDDLPNVVVQAAKTVILNLIGATLAASDSKYPASKLIVEHVRSLGGVEESTIIGKNFKTSAVNAAFANGVMPYILDVDGHRSDLAMLASLAVGEKIGAHGKDLITAVVVGYDVQARLISAMKVGSLYKRGFHHSGVCGCFGATAGAGKILGLDEERFLNAFGLAGSLASGLMTWLTEPTEMLRTFTPGMATRNGVTAALLAEAGFAGPSAIFEGDYNVFDAFSGNYDREVLIRDLGKEFKVLKESIKPLEKACCSFLQEALDALWKITGEHNLSPEEIKEIVLRLPETRRGIVDNVAIRSHNGQYLMAVGAYDGKVVPDNVLGEDRRRDPKVMELYNHVKLVGDPELEKIFLSSPTTGASAPSIVEVVTKGGVKFVERVDYAKGSPMNPMTRKEIEKKFTDLATTVVSAQRANEILRLINELETVKDVRQLGDLLRTQ